MKYRYPFTNSIVFSLVMRDPSLCRDLLQLILPERQVQEVRLHEDYLESASAETERTVIVGVDSRSVRLDVLFTDSTAWYDIEMQVQNKGNIPKRVRYTHSAVDTNILEPGQDYNMLKPGYVIFLCCFDCFGRGEAVYRFLRYDEEKCLPLGDESYTIILNSKAGDREDTPQPLRELFKYMNESVIAENNDLLKRIDSSVDRWNSPERRNVIMTYEQEILMEANRAREEGIEIGRDEGIKVGQIESLHNVAKDMKTGGEPIEKIIRYTGLTADEINDL